MISKADKRDSIKVVTRILEDRTRAPRDPKRGDLASRAHHPHRQVVCDATGEQQKVRVEGRSLERNVRVRFDLPLDYEWQLCPACVSWVSSRVNFFDECCAEFGPTFEAHQSRRKQCAIDAPAQAVSVREYKVYSGSYYGR